MSDVYARTASGTFQPESRVNGLALKNRLKNLDDVVGPGTAERVLQQMPVELREALRYGRVVAGGWYPIGWLRALHAAVQQVTGGGLELSRQLGYVGTLQNFTTVHRFFLTVLSVEAVLERASRIFGSYHDKGSLSVLESRPGMARLAFGGCEGFDRNLWAAVRGSVEALLELCQARGGRVRITSGGGEADSACEMVAYWGDA